MWMEKLIQMNPANLQQLQCLLIPMSGLMQKMLQAWTRGLQLVILGVLFMEIRLAIGPTKAETAITLFFRQDLQHMRVL